MIELGKRQVLTVLYEKDFGVFLGEPGEERGILLPGQQVPEGVHKGDTLAVFVYKDSQDRLIATVREPKLEKGMLGKLTVREVTKIGAFLDWGLERDLFMPYREMNGKVKAGDEVLAAVYEDRSGRLAATMKIYPYLQPADARFRPGDMVRGTVYEIRPEVGVFVAVCDTYYGLIPAQNVQKTYHPGEGVEVRIVRLRSDGKLDLDARKLLHMQMKDDAETLLTLIEEEGGVLPYGEKTEPEIIREKTGLSKAAFKRAVGRLYTEGKVIPGPDKIRRV